MPSKRMSLICIMVLLSIATLYALPSHRWLLIGDRSQTVFTQTPAGDADHSSEFSKSPKETLFRPKRATRSADRLVRRETEEPAGRAGDDDFEKARQWFFSQRTYPFDSTPSGARERAWKLRPMQQMSSAALPATVPSWQPVGPLPMVEGSDKYTGHIQALAVSPADPNIVLVGSVAGGIWRSTNGGTTFVPVSDDQVDLEVGSIAFAPSNPQIAYAGMGGTTYGSFLGTGVLKSSDAGQTWKRISNNTLPNPGTTSKILVDPTDSNRVYLAQYSGPVFSSGFWLSTDGGVSWRSTLPGLTVDLALHPSNPQTLFLSMSRVDQSGNPKPGLYRSTDRGETWMFIFTGPFDTESYPNFKIGMAPGNPAAMYLLGHGAIAGSDARRVFASSDGGNSWTDRGATGLQTFDSDYITIDPVDVNTLYIGQFDVMKSTNGGVTWAAISNHNTHNANFMHTDQHCLALFTVNRNVFLAGGDGGLYKTTDGGITYTSLNDTLSLAQFYGLTLHPTDPMVAFGGTQDNGTNRRQPSSSNWRLIAGGDGGPTVINPLDPQMVFVSFQAGGIWRLRSNGDSFDAVVANGSTFGGDRVAFIPPFVGNGVNSTLYFGSWRLFTSTDLGNTWSAPAGTLDLTKGGNDVLSVLSVAPSDASVIYSGSSQGRVLVSADAGKNWIDITSGLPNRYIASIKVDPLNSSVAYLSVSGYGSAHVFKTTTRGSSWTDVSGNLPDIPTSALLIDPIIPSTIYAGTDIGVFRSTSGGFVWENFNNGMPPAVVSNMVARPSGLIRLATFGRGAYELTANGQPLANSIDDAQFFVTQHYLDFLNRQPDSSGLAFWTSQITNCGANQGCIDASRVSVSASFFLSIEFQQTGYLVERLYKSAYGDANGGSTIGGAHQLSVPIVRFNEFLPDTSQIGQGVVVGQTGWETVLENNKQKFASAFVQRSRFSTAFPTTMTPVQFVDKLNQNAGNVLSASERTTAINLFGGATNTTNLTARVQVLRQVAEDQDLQNGELSRAFVLMQYYGYLRRDPNGGQDTDYSGYDFWLTKLNQFNGNFIDAEMVKAFITSIEYRQRFGL
jgi:photosystem II stability/assembly factor-like uncharacterized protein